MSAAPNADNWRFWIDRGGTFTDVIAAAPDGRLIARKLLSENPSLYADAASKAVSEILAEHGASAAREVRIGTTVATNALLERKGEKTALLITHGLRDCLQIGTQHRPDLFALNVQRAGALYSSVFEVRERMGVDGTALTTLDEESVHAALAAARAAGCTALAICYLHGLRYRAHEARTLELAHAFGFETVTASHQASARHKFVPRGQTAVADAYLSPVLERYVDQVCAALPADSTLFMKSDGGVTPAAQVRGKDAVLSGPAGGIVGAAEIAKAHGYSKVIAFDMGGTSTDVAHYNGTYDTADAPEISGIKLDVPMLDIHTIAAGGGSILHHRDGRFQVGPQSAGAQPGPAAYGRGGPLTITDCHVLLGRLQPTFFPHIFGEDGRQPLDAARVTTLFKEMRDAIDPALSLEDVANGFLDVACEQMARAIKKITQERGIDPKGYALVAFGGAGGQLACRVAERIGVGTILVHPFAGLLSALGIGLTGRTHRTSDAVDCPLSALDTAGTTARLRRAGEAALPGSTTTCNADVRQSGSDMTLSVPVTTPADMERAFIAAHTQRFGFAPEGTLHVNAVHGIAALKERGLDTYRVPLNPTGEATQTVAAHFGEARTAICADAKTMDTIEGPAILLSDGSTTIVEPGWTAVRQGDGTLVLSGQASARDDAATTKQDPILLEIFHHRFMAIAEQMGAVLEQTAHSINIKERLDFSCAVFDASGNLVANAPHMPVHLGSMGETVLALIKRGVPFAPNTAYAHNDPYEGGTHLPDVTTVMPVFDASGDTLTAFVASRGHHADIGGITPGSMPAHSVHINEEGCVFSAVKILEGGKVLRPAIEAVLAKGPHPARSPSTNIADLRAQIAACETGAAAMRALMAQTSSQHVSRYMGYIQDNAASVVKRLLTGLPGGHAEADLEGLGTVQVEIRPQQNGRRAAIDFTGTSPQGAHNFNSPLAVTKAAVLYVLRCMVREDIPLNAGCLQPLDLIVPEGCLLNPAYPAAVVAGNVETSQAVTNLLFEAFGVKAASQGTMNNVIFGNAQHQYYETLGGGTGAGPDFAGESAIHSDMTNSRLTDPEVLEARLPIRVRQMLVREGSGGRGAQGGGNGLIREIEFLEEMDLSILSSHRASGPRGLAGGGGGAPGANTVLSTEHSTALPARASHRLSKGDRLRIETPGGGAYGRTAK